MTSMAFQAHARSISLPSRLHPGSLIVEERLNKSKALEESDSPCSLPSIKARLVGLGELYASFTDLIRSPLTKQAPSHYDQGRLVEDALDSSVSLINACTTSRDIVSSLKDHARGLQSALRRRRSSGIEVDVAAYVVFRKKSTKEIARCIRELKQTETKSNAFAPLLNADLHLAMIIRVLREVVSIAISIFQSLLVFLSVPPLFKCKCNNKWSFISRLVIGGGSKRSSSGHERILNEVGGIDVVLFSLQSSAATDLEVVQRRLRVLDSGSQNLETALDALFRRLVQNRVSLLNILTTH